MIYDIFNFLDYHYDTDDYIKDCKQAGIPEEEIYSDLYAFDDEEEYNR